MDNNLENIVKNYFIIDMHFHPGPITPLGEFYIDDEKIVEIYKKFNIAHAIGSHAANFYTNNFGIEMLFKALDKFKDFLFGYLTFNPNCREKSMVLMKKYINKKEILGIKIHPSFHLCYPGDTKYEDFWKFADENALVILTHSWNPNVPNKIHRFSDPFLFENIVKKYKNLKLILGHAGGKGEYLYKVADLVKKYENLYVDFAGDTFEPGIIEHYIKTTGSEKILFGTDCPCNDIRFHLIRLLDAKISDNDRKNIFGLNASKLFKINNTK